jgi:heme/copper-type cytochrome/quinol oxidase subunit 3
MSRKRNRNAFTTADSNEGSTFFVATGFHGLYAIIGTEDVDC